MLVCVYYRITGILLLAALYPFVSFFPFPESPPTPFLCQLIAAAQLYFDQGISAATKKPTKLAGTNTWSSVTNVNNR